VYTKAPLFTGRGLEYCTERQEIYARVTGAMKQNGVCAQRAQGRYFVFRTNKPGAHAHKAIIATLDLIQPPREKGASLGHLQGRGEKQLPSLERVITMNHGVSRQILQIRAVIYWSCSYSREAGSDYYKRSRLSVSPRLEMLKTVRGFPL
jgi:hypothetical protein